MCLKCHYSATLCIKDKSGVTTICVSDSIGSRAKISIHVKLQGAFFAKAGHIKRNDKLVVSEIEHITESYTEYSNRVTL